MICSHGQLKRQCELCDALGEIDRLRAALSAAEAERDRLMLEFCPDEMSDEQRANWAAHQKPYEMTDAEKGVMKRALLASSALKPSVPSPAAAAHADVVLVPREPTKEMIEAGVKAKEGNAVYRCVSGEGILMMEADTVEVYAAMLAAARKEPPNGK